MKRSLEVRSARRCSRQTGFTLLDLLAVLAVCGLLALLLLPAQAGSRSRSQNLRCLDNLRQVMGAILMYTHDNHDLFPPNPDDATTLRGYTWCPGSVSGGTPGAPLSPDTFNPDLLADSRLCLILSYLQSNITVFRCTADPRMGLYSGSNPAKVGTIVPATRTISLSGAVGTIDSGYVTGTGHSGVPNLPVTGYWLDGTRFGNRHNHPWRTYGKLSDMVVPAPASLLTVTEEEPLSINDGCFATCCQTPEWVDFPSTLHNLSGVVSFGDGHAELHKWQSPGTRLTQYPGLGTAVSPTDPDWNWVAQHTSVRAY